jgi:hypothetical protein
MTHTARLMAGVAAALAGALAMACQNGVTGPSLSASIQTLSLAPTVSAPSSQNICCCHVIGSVKNTASIVEHVQLQFPAKSNGAEVSRAIVLVNNVTPGEVRGFEAPGLLVPCGTLDVNQVKADAIIRPIGLWEPQ